MFTKPFSEIEFNDIVAFCKEWPEGVRVEYKRKIPDAEKRRKSVSSFANTLGGFLVIGVETDENNMAILPIEGMPGLPGIEERIVESAFTGINPPVTPEVKVYDVPSKTGNIVVLVRVNESPEAPHAIQNSTRVYIRAGSTTQPYEEPGLADIDRIEYMLKRREKPQDLGDRIINRIDERVEHYWFLPSQRIPNLTLIARPVFPYRRLISPSEIYEYMRASQFIPFNDSASDFGTRQVIGGVCFVGPTVPYWEINEHGIIYLREKLIPENDKQNKNLEFRELLKNHCELVEVATDFYRTRQYLGDVEITAKLRDVRGKNLMFDGEPRYKLDRPRQSLDFEISASIKCHAFNLIESEKANDVIVNLLSQLLWAFNIRPGEWESKACQRLEQWRQ